MAISAARKTAIATEKDKLAAIAGKAGNPDANDVAALKLACATLEARAYSVLVELPEGALSPDPASAAQAAVDKALLMCGPTASPRHCAVARHIGATLPARVRLRDLEAAADDEAAVDFPRLLNSATAMKTEVESKWAEARRQAAASDVQVAANAGADALKPSAELNNSMRSIACRVEHASVAALNDRSGLDAAGAEKDFADYSIPLMAALVAATDYDPAQSACYGKADSVCQRTLASSLIAKCAAQAPRVSLTN